jgi:hypothetical protein
MKRWMCAAAAMVCVLASGAAPATSPAQEAKIQKLRDQALTAGNYPTTRAALLELRTMGQAAHPAILEVARSCSIAMPR